MARRTIEVRLTDDERRRITEISVEPYRSEEVRIRAQAALLLDENSVEERPSRKQIRERLGRATGFLTRLTQAIEERGAIDAVVGSKRGRSGKKLTDAETEELRKEAATGTFSQRELARRYGVSAPTIGRQLRDQIDR